MSLLTDAEIAQMRDAAEEALPGTAVIQARTFASDGGGDGTWTWTASGTVACRVSPMPSPENSEPLTGDRITPDADWIITIPAQTTITRKGRVVSAGVTYEVTALRAPRDWELTRRVECNEVIS